jgi:hypothetical protein
MLVGTWHVLERSNNKLGAGARIAAAVALVASGGAVRHVCAGFAGWQASISRTVGRESIAGFGDIAVPASFGAAF